LKLRSATCSGGLSTTHLVSEVPLAAVGRTRSRRGRQRRLAASRGAWNRGSCRRPARHSTAGARTLGATCESVHSCEGFRPSGS